MDPTTTLQRSIATAGDVIAKITPDQHDKATPCPSMNVKALADHLVGAMGMFAASATDDKDAERSEPGDDIKGSFDEASSRLLKAWEQPGMMDKTFTMPFGDVPAAVLLNMCSMESLTHAWDLAKATGQSTAFPEDVSAEVLTAAHQTLLPEFRSTGPDASFGPEVEIAGDAHPADRLAAFMGRQP